MKKVAIVVQRCHESVVGGSESLALQYATVLKDAYEVEVLTTTAIDTADWANVLPEGIETRDGVDIHRFSVSVGRSPHWFKLDDRYQRDFDEFGFRKLDGAHPHWPISLQEELIRHQGPYSESLLKFIRHGWTDYHAMIFVTYLYPTTYFGMLEIPKNHCLLVPTLHDEPQAYLPVYKYMAQRARAALWLTDAEQQFGQALWGDLPGRIVAMNLDTKLREPAKLGVPYVLYCGRIDRNKGCRALFEYFIEFKKNYPSNLRLILVGKAEMDVPEHPDIEFVGFAPTEKKFELMAGASILIMPSRQESFSIVTLEAMAQGTAVLADGGAQVLREHVTQSGAGRIYYSYESFAGGLREMLDDQSELSAMGTRGRDYVASKYPPERIRESLITAVEYATGNGEHRI